MYAIVIFAQPLIMDWLIKQSPCQKDMTYDVHRFHTNVKTTAFIINIADINGIGVTLLNANGHKRIININSPE